MRDFGSRDVETAAYLAREGDWRDADDRPSFAECDDGPEAQECPVSGEWCIREACVPACKLDEPAVEAPSTDHDPLFDIILSCAAGAEEEARDTYGDRTVDRAIDRALEES